MLLPRTLGEKVSPRSKLGACANRAETYVFHVNANSVNGAGNMQAKDNMVLPVMRAKGLVPVNRLTYADYHPNDPSCSGQGFVYGWWQTGQWTLRVHSLAVRTRQVTTATGYRTYETASIRRFKTSEPLPSGITMDI